MIPENQTIIDEDAAWVQRDIEHLARLAWHVKITVEQLFDAYGELFVDPPEELDNKRMSEFLARADAIASATDRWAQIGNPEFDPGLPLFKTR